MDQWHSGSTLPVGDNFFLHFFLSISCIAIHNKLTLKHLIWWKILKKFPLKIKQKYWNVPAIQQRSVGLNAHWKVTEQFNTWNPDFSGHASRFQWKFLSCDHYPEIVLVSTIKFRSRDLWLILSLLSDYDMINDYEKEEYSWSRSLILWEKKRKVITINFFKKSLITRT